MRPRRRAVPDDAELIIARHLVHWSHLDDDERHDLIDIAAWLLRHKRWEAAAGFALDDTTRLVIAAQAALLVLGLTVAHYDLVTSVIVHPSSTVTHGERAGPVAGTATDAIVPIHGLAQDRNGPVLIAWDQALDAARHPERGHNVVFHEFAHKIDMLDGLIDGTPPLGAASRDTWVRVCTAVFESMRAGVDHPPLDDYGSVNPGEFFAVATEAFFNRPIELRRTEPALYGVLSSFYSQDPARRVEDRN